MNMAKIRKQQHQVHTILAFLFPNFIDLKMKFSKYGCIFSGSLPLPLVEIKLEFMSRVLKMPTNQYII